VPPKLAKRWICVSLRSLTLGGSVRYQMSVISAFCEIRYFESIKTIKSSLSQTFTPSSEYYLIDHHRVLSDSRWRNDCRLTLWPTW
jgi:hypothetical protein